MVHQDIQSLLDSIESTKNAIEKGNQEAAEKYGWEMCNHCDKVMDSITEKDYSPEMCKLQLVSMATLLDLHIMRNDPIDIAILARKFLNKYMADVRHFTNWTEEEKKPLSQIAARMVRHTQDYFDDLSFVPHKPIATRSGECKCLLCKKNLADKKGSHMVPHMLITSTFSYDGSKGRDKVVVNVDNLSEGYKEYYFGHEVYDDTINGLLGRSLSDEEIEKESNKKNALTHDYVFCKECENRFGVIESYYSQIRETQSMDYPPAIPYLFWLSVIWRMSVGQMGCKLEPTHEEKLRKVLNQCLALKREDIITKKNKLGYCAYSLYIAEDTRDETLGIFGPHSPTIPYQALMGKYFINFYTSKNTAISFCKKNKLPAEDLNFGEEKEKVGQFSFIEFWCCKRQILDTIWNNDRSVWHLGQQGHQTLSKYEPINIEECKELFSIDGNQIFDNARYSSLFTAENPNLIRYPRSIRKILLWMKAHKDNDSIEEMSKEIGYSPEEIAVMVEYFACSIEQ